MEEFEIPEAIRENPDLPKKSRLPLPLLAILLAIGVVLLAISGFISIRLLSPSNKPNSTIEPKAVTETQAPNPPELTSPSKIPVPNKTQVNLLGHFPYDVAPSSELAPVSSNPSLKLRSAAANKFEQMQAAAKADGVEINLISAFRDLETQEQLFFGVKEQRVQDAKQRAEVSAPPGYSEHHTGYAVDLGDGDAPSTNLETDFEQTAAFDWLQQNALKYSFEMSFSRDNKQGVNYEPWHWRFVGDRNSLETFYKVRN